MLEHFKQWVGSKEAKEASNKENQLREISLEYPEAELVRMTRNFDPARRLGAGSYGAVYRGTLTDGSEVAIKVMEVDDGGVNSSGFADEVRVLSKFRHPNLVTLMGWGLGADRRFLVYELLSGGDVAHRLQKCRGDGGQPFNWTERLWVALDAACGLSHMHNSTPKAFHRDIKTANILLDRSGTAKMADFGLSGIAQNKNKLNMTCEQISGTPGYACPHYIKSGRVTEATEVYAFGMVLLEILMNSMPACVGQGGAIVYPIFQTVMPQAPGAVERALSALDPAAHWPPTLAKELIEIALACAAMLEPRRPKFAELGRRLRHLCEKFCKGQRDFQVGRGGDPERDPLTVPQMNSQLARGHGGQVTDPPTKPQLHTLGGRAGQVTDPPTRPQLQTPAAQPLLGGGNGGPSGPNADPPTQPNMFAPPGRADLDPPTQPQLHRVLSANRGAEATRPQMGVRGAVNGSEPPTRPQLGAQNAGAGGAAPPTNPQMYASNGASLLKPAPAAAPPTCPKQHLTGAGGASLALTPLGHHAAVPTPHGVRQFLDAIKEIWDGGWEGATEGQVVKKASDPSNLAEVVLECVHAVGVDVKSMPLKHRSLVLQAGQGPWTVGRQQQPNLFGRLVPDETLRAGISRSHMAFRWEKPCLYIKKLTPNPFMVNNQQLQAQVEIPVKHGSQLALCGRDMSSFLVFAVLLRNEAAVSAEGPTPLPTRPDVPAKPMEPMGAAPAGQPPEKASLMPEPKGPASAAPSAPTELGEVVLECVQSSSTEVRAMPLKQRCLVLQQDGDAPWLVGRQQQPEIFAQVVPDPALLAGISRSHLALRWEKPVLHLKKLTQSVVLVNGKSAPPQEIVVPNGAQVAFCGGTNSSPFLVFAVAIRTELAADEQPQQPAPPPPKSLPAGMARAPTVLAQADRERLPSQQGLRPVSQGVRLAQSLAEVPGACLSQPPLLPAMDEAESRSAGPRRRGSSRRRLLLLTGSTVRPEFPKECRLLEVGEDGLTVGRAHQQSLHVEAFDKELREYLSRDHFRIECSRTGDYRLIPLSSNPIWRESNGQLTEAVRGEPALPLSPGDAVLLFTGAEDCTLDGPGSLGTLRWLFQDSEDLAGGQQATEQRRAARSSSGEQADRRVERKGSGALQVPLLGIELAGSGDHRRPPGSPLDLSMPHLNDKFAASGFAFK